MVAKRNKNGTAQGRLGAHSVDSEPVLMGAHVRPGSPGFLIVGSFDCREWMNQVEQRSMPKCIGHLSLLN